MSRPGRAAAVFTDFRLADGVTEPTDATEFRALWDTTNLYLSFVCHDPQIIATMTKRDSPLYAEDCVECFLSTGGDLWRYFEFEFSPKNVQMDASVFPNKGRKDKVVDYSWNCKGLQHRHARRGGGGGAALDHRDRHSLHQHRPGPQGSHGRPDVAHQLLPQRSTACTRRSTICWSPMYGPADFHRRDRFGHFVFARQ